MFQQHHSLRDVHSRCAYRTFVNVSREIVRSKRAADIFVAIAVDRLGQRTAVCFSDVAQRIIRILDLIQPHENFLVQTVIKV